jgi:hypothetical protein
MRGEVNGGKRFTRFGIERGVGRMRMEWRGWVVGDGTWKKEYGMEEVDVMRWKKEDMRKGKERTWMEKTGYNEGEGWDGTERRGRLKRGMEEEGGRVTSGSEKREIILSSLPATNFRASQEIW